MKTIDLLKFCYKDLGRENIAKPWHLDRFTLATDGRILIRVDRIECDSAEGPKRGPLLDAILSHLEEAPSELLDVPAPVGKIIETRCDCHLYEDDDRVDPECFDCDGRGYIKEWQGCPEMVGDREISGQYLSLILEELPNPKLFIPSKTEPKAGMIGIVFDGGRGVLMPMRPGCIKEWQLNHEGVSE